MGIFFVLFHSLSRKEEKALYFGLFSILLGARVLLTGNRMIYEFFPNIPWVYVNQLDYLFGMMLFPVLALLIRQMGFVKVPKTITRFYIGTAVLIVVFGLVFPNQWYRVFFELFRYVILLFAGYFIYQVARGIQHKRVSAVFMLGSGILMLFAIIAEFFFAASQFLFVAASLGMVGLMAIMVIDDILFIKQSKQILETQVIIDPLTNVYNRLYLSRLMESAYAPQNVDFSLYILFIDLNDFKGVNDRYGHLAGDTVLIAVANRLRAIIDPIGKVFRYGGDEFIAIVSLQEHQMIQEVVAAIGKAIQEPIAIASGSLEISASVGFTPFHSERESLEHAIHRADTTMYEEKSKKKRSS
ncbi:MAG: GGDEF domain-containing protein [Bacillus subtilis]|nr:GGDEF domain-containing protein [Bacillus subtilis]